MTTTLTAPRPADPGPDSRPEPSATPAGGRRRPQLSDREREVLLVWLLCDTKREVTEQLYLAPSTVNTYIQRVRAKYDELGRPARTKAMLLVRAIQDGLIDLDLV